MADVTAVEEEVKEQELVDPLGKLSIKERVDKRLKDEENARDPRTLEEIAEFTSTRADFTPFLVELLNRTEKLTLEQKKAMIDRSCEATNRWADYSSKKKVHPNDFYNLLSEERQKTKDQVGKFKPAKVRPVQKTRIKV